MRRTLNVLFAVLLFVLLGMSYRYVYAQVGNQPCPTGKICIEAAPLGYTTTCNNTYYDGAEVKNCYGQDQNGMTIYGNCCVDDDPCDEGMECYPESAGCIDEGGVPKKCNQGKLGCCKVPVEFEPCPDVEWSYCAEPDTEYCIEIGTIQNCMSDGSPGCCVDTRGRVDCPDDYSCQSANICSLENPEYRAGISFDEKCGIGGLDGCCVPGGLDDGQVLCETGYGCLSWETARSYCGMGGHDYSYAEKCGRNGADGCCVYGEEDEEDFWNDPPIPEPAEPIDRDFLPDFYDTWDLETQAANVYNLIFPIGIFISIAMIIVAGYGYLTSTGNPDKVRAASEKLTSAITGAVFIILSLAILKVIINSLLGSYIP